MAKCWTDREIIKKVQNMKVEYRGHLIQIIKTNSASGEEVFVCGISLISDGYECAAWIEDASASIHDFIDEIKGYIDAELLKPEPWDRGDYD